MAVLIIIIHKKPCVLIPTYRLSDRGAATFDLLYTNAKYAYKALGLPKLRKADHSLRSLVPQYRPIDQREKTS